MKRFLLVVTLAIVSAPVFAADVGVSVNIGEPGFYGQIDIGNSPRPEVIYQHPMMIEREAPGMQREPMYLHVPPGYERHWSRHCHQYNACGRPVYFVRDKWYREDYAPRYREHEKDRGARHDERRHDDHRDNGRRDDERGGDNYGDGHPSDRGDYGHDHN
ncbi:MAG: hypothetical protein ACYC9J_05775 [Sulfuricaulis sp.]